MMKTIDSVLSVPGNVRLCACPCMCSLLAIACIALDFWTLQSDNALVLAIGFSFALASHSALALKFRTPLSIHNAKCAYRVQRSCTRAVALQRRSALAPNSGANTGQANVTIY